MKKAQIVISAREIVIGNVQVAYEHRAGQFTKQLVLSEINTGLCYWYGNNELFSKPKRRFRNLNAESEVKVKVTGVNILTCMERSCLKACVCQILQAYLNWYASYEQLSKPKRRF